jgi:hypothetical protein
VTSAIEAPGCCDCSWRVVMTFRDTGKAHTVKKEGSKWSYESKGKASLRVCVCLSKRKASSVALHRTACCGLLRGKETLQTCALLPSTQIHACAHVAHAHKTARTRAHMRDAH